MNNRQRANGITAGIISIMLGIVLLAIMFPYHFLGLFAVLSLASLYILFMYCLFNSSLSKWTLTALRIVLNMKYKHIEALTIKDIPKK